MVKSPSLKAAFMRILYFILTGKKRKENKLHKKVQQIQKNVHRNDEKNKV